MFENETPAADAGATASPVKEKFCSICLIYTCWRSSGRHTPADKSTAAAVVVSFSAMPADARQTTDRLLVARKAGLHEAQFFANMFMEDSSCLQTEGKFFTNPVVAK